jgi:hypothetical protein
VEFDNCYLTHINNLGDLVGGYEVGGDYNYTFVASYDTQNLLHVTKDLGNVFVSTYYYQSGITDSRLVLLSEPGFSGLRSWEYDINLDTLNRVSNEADGVRLSNIDSYSRYVGDRYVNNRRFPVAFDPLNGGIIWQSTRKGEAQAINDPSLVDLVNEVGLGDILFSEDKTGRDPIYLRNPVWGELNMDLLLAPQDADRQSWLSETVGYSYLHMTGKRADTNFGAIAGCLAVGNKPFLLVPVPYTR